MRYQCERTREQLRAKEESERMIEQREREKRNRSFLLQHLFFPPFTFLRTRNRRQNTDVVTVYTVQMEKYRSVTIQIIIFLVFWWEIVRAVVFDDEITQKTTPGRIYKMCREF